MTRVASLYLPDWSIDRLRRIERRAAPPAEADGRAAPSTRLGTGFDALGADAAAERAQQCSVPKEGGWRPGARWARTGPAGSGLADTREEVEAAVAALPAHRRPPSRELGRVSQAADHPFRGAEPPSAGVREMARRTEGAEPLFRPGTRGWDGRTVDAAVDTLPAHQRPTFQELSRRSEVVGSPFRPMQSDEAGPRPALPPLRSGEDAPARLDRRDRHRNEAPSLARLAAMPPVQGPGEDVVVRRAIRAHRRSARDGHGGEAGYVAPPQPASMMGARLAQLAAMPAVQFPGEGPHPDNHGKSEPTAPTYGAGRFFQTGRTLGSVVARVCREDEAPALAHRAADEPPLVTTRKIGARVEIAAVNPAARALGLAPGTALTTARAQVPGLEVRAADPAGDAADLLALATLLARRWAPTVTVSDENGLLIDLTGVSHLHGGEERFARRLVRLLARHGVTARVAVADSAGAAWALARSGTGPVTICAPGAQVVALGGLPVALLRLEAPALELLARLGIDRIGQLLGMPRAPLVRRFGRAITLRLDQAAGRAPEPLDPVVPPQRIAVERRFAEPIATPDAIEHVLRILAADLAVALAKAGLGARAVELVAARVDGVPQRLRLGFARATRDAPHMIRMALRRIEEIEPGYGLDAVALHVRRADPLGPEMLAPALAAEERPDLSPLIDALANRIGLSRLWRVTPVESDVPERSLRPASPLDPPAERVDALKPDDVRRLDERARDHPWHPRWPRPVRLLRHPERIDHVLAGLPDQPPMRFTWRGTAHSVVHAEGPERIAGEWWRRGAERDAVRDYFRVEDEGGRRFWLFRRGDGVRGVTGDLSWFIHGLGG